MEGFGVGKGGLGDVEGSRVLRWRVSGRGELRCRGRALL